MFVDQLDEGGRKGSCGRLRRGARVWQRRRPRRRRGAALLDEWVDSLRNARSSPLLSCHHYLGMFYALGNYLSERRRGLTKVTAYVGSAYVLGRYVSARLEEVRTTLVQERVAREKYVVRVYICDSLNEPVLLCFSLRRRFDQNQQDISFTVMALLPALGAHILQDMDVEGVTQELQSFSKAPKERIEPPHAAPPSESSITSSVDNHRSPDADMRSENGSVSVISSNDGVATDLSTSAGSWVDQFSMPSAQVSHLSESTGDGAASPSPKSSIGAELSDSIITTSSMSSAAAPGPPNPSVSGRA